MDAPPAKPEPAPENDAYETFWNCVDAVEEVTPPKKESSGSAYELFWETLDAD
jgi:hypothetical protein